MTYKLLIGQKSYSSWSLRGWLCFAAFRIPVDVTRTVIYDECFFDDVANFGGHRTVPAVVTPDNGLLTDSLAIAWHLAEAFPNRHLLPEAPTERAEAISAIAEMHAGFTSVRAECPMNLRTSWDGFVASEDVLADCARAEDIWATALNRSNGPFLYGEFSLADVFFTPLATRFLTYGLPMTDTTRSYMSALMSFAPIVQWRQEGLQEDAEVAFYDKAPLKREPFPTV